MPNKVVLQAQCVFLAGLAFIALTGTASAQENVHLTVNRIDTVDFPNVRVFVTVSGATGLPIEDLASGDFSLSEDGAPVPGFEVSEGLGSSEPIYVVLAIDTSGSMTASATDVSGSRTTALGNTQDAARRFVRSLAPADLIGLVVFSDDAAIAVPLGQAGTEVEEAIAGLVAAGETALHDAIVVSVGMLKNLPPGRKAVVLLADGENNSSTFSFDEAVAEAARWSIPVYPIGFGNVNRNTMDKIALLSGGYSQIAPDSSKLGEAFDSVLRVLRHQYVLEYVSGLPADGSEHSLSVNLSYLGTQVGGIHKFNARPGLLFVDLQGLEDGDVVAGLVELTPEISSPSAVREVQFLLDNSLLSTLTDPPFVFEWDSTTAVEGNHTLAISATDIAGNMGAAELHIVVRPVISVEWASPTEGNRIAGDLDLSANVDALGVVERVEYYLDGELLGSKADAPYAFPWSTVGIEPGDHLLRAVATDNTGLTAESEIHVTVGLGGSSSILVLSLVVLAAGTIVMVPLVTRRRKRRGGKGQAGRRARGEPGDMGPLVLREVSGLQPGRVWQLGDQAIRIGRKRTDNDIPVAGQAASRQHAVIRREEGRYILENHNEGNPSYVNGEPIIGQRILEPGDTIGIGESAFAFEKS